jgi:hypothetical protein
MLAAIGRSKGVKPIHPASHRIREGGAVAREAAEAEEDPKLGEVQGAKLDPIGVVKRMLTRPDGSTVVVEVPVYPPFRLAERPSGRKPARSRSAPSLKRKSRTAPRSKDDGQGA